MGKYGVLVWNVEECDEKKLPAIIAIIRHYILKEFGNGTKIIHVALLEVYPSAHKNVLYSGKSKKELGQLHYNVNWKQNSYQLNPVDSKDVKLWNDSDWDVVLQKCMDEGEEWQENPVKTITRPFVIIQFPKPFNFIMITAHTKSGQFPRTLLQIKMLYQWLLSKTNGRFLLAGDLNYDLFKKWKEKKDVEPKKDKTIKEKEFLEFLLSDKNALLIRPGVSRVSSRARLDWGICGTGISVKPVYPKVDYDFKFNPSKYSDHKAVVYVI